MHSVSARSNNPWYLLALMLDEGFIMKKNERINPWITPIKMNNEMTLRWVEVFMYQM